MIGLFGLVIWAGYGIGSYGWVLMKGYDVPMSAWFSPVRTFDWRSDPGFVPKGRVFPGQAPGSGSAPPSGSAQQDQPNLGQQVWNTITGNLPKDSTRTV